MLLPSALDCAPGIQPMRSTYPSSKDMLSPPPRTFQSSASPVFNTCRTLQSLLTTTLAPAPPANKPPRVLPSLASPIDFDPTKSVRKPKSSQRIPYRTATAAPTSQTPPRPSKKRRRSDAETDERTPPSTPKRQRLCPPTLPPGLSRADFESLQAEAASIPIPQTPASPAQSRRPLNPSPATATTPPAPFTSPDSSALVSLILHKLRLRQSDWDECARHLGAKGKDSLGERFKVLVGENGGEGGLRRGSGRRSRGKIGGVEFGGPLITPSDGELGTEREGGVT